MKRSTAGLLTFGIILVLVIGFGVDLFNSVWSFPGNFDAVARFPSAEIPLGSIPWMMLALLGTGIYATVRLGLPQLRHFAHGVRTTFGVFDNPKDAGDLNHFRALTTALSATVGIGNIAGVATAVYYGGPGALFWMWVTAFFGTALKYSECALALEFREILPNGQTAGGPMYTIERGLGRRWKGFAIMFACFAVICSFATGNAIQAFTVSDQIYAEVASVVGETHWITAKMLLWKGFEVSWQQVINGVFMAAVVGLVIIGGIRRIGRVTGYLAPIMAAVYVIAALAILLFHAGELHQHLALVFRMAFNPPAEIAGTAGGGFLVLLNTMIWGIKRGLYSNEAGQGSAAIAHSTAKTPYAVREGTVAMLGPFIDTLVICSLTGLVIISTGAWHHTEFFVTRIDPGFQGELLNASLLTSHAFQLGLSPITAYGDKIVTVSVLLFAVSTAISWSFYGDRATHYLFGDRAIPIYRWFFVLFVFIGAIAELEAVWAFGDAALGFMALPNLLSIALLAPMLAGMTRRYFSTRHEPFQKKGAQD